MTPDQKALMLKEQAVRAAEAHQAWMAHVAIGLVLATAMLMVGFAVWAWNPNIGKALADIWDWITRLLTWNWYRYDEALCSRLAAELLDTPIPQWQAEAIAAMDRPKRGTGPTTLEHYHGLKPSTSVSPAASH